MQQYTVDDGISAMKHELGKFKEPHDSVFDVMPRLVSKRHPGIYTEVTHIWLSKFIINAISGFSEQRNLKTIR